MSTLLYVRTSSAGTGPDVFLQDLGITVATSATWTLLSSSSPERPDGSNGQFTAREIRDSVDLFNAIDSGLLEWSKDGIAVETAVSYTSDYMLFQDFTDDSPYFLNLTVSGTLTASGFDISNHFNGGPNKHDASEIDVEGTYSNIPAAPSDLETVIASINTALSTASSFAFGVVNADSGTATADVGSDTISITGANGIVTSAADNPETLSIDGNALLPRDGSRPMTGDLNLAGNSVVSGLNATFTGNVNLGGATQFKLPQATDVPSTFTGGSEGDLAWDTDDEALYAHDGTQWFAIAPASGIITDHGGLTGLLDDDHPQYALLNGNAVRNTVSGVFDFTNGDLILPVDVTPPAGVNGQITTIGGVQYVYDGTRSKWLSVNHETLWAARNSGSANNIYLRGPDSIATSATGFRMLRNGTITGITAAFSAVDTATIEVRRNDSPTVLASLVVTAAAGAQNATINVDFNAGDEIQIYLNGSAPYPMASVEIAWRV